MHHTNCIVEGPDWSAATFVSVKSVTISIFVSQVQPGAPLIEKMTLCPRLVLALAYGDAVPVQAQGDYVALVRFPVDRVPRQAGVTLLQMTPKLVQVTGAYDEGVKLFAVLFVHFRQKIVGQQYWIH
jgi:hypothetical protein